MSQEDAASDQAGWVFQRRGRSKRIHYGPPATDEAPATSPEPLFMRTMHLALESCYASPIGISPSARFSVRCSRRCSPLRNRVLRLRGWCVEKIAADPGHPSLRLVDGSHEDRAGQLLT